MSNIGKLPIKLPQGVTVAVEGNEVKVTGSKGTLTKRLVREVKLEQKDGNLIVSANGESKRHNAMHGTTRAILNNAVKGVFEGFEKTLEMVGTGYRGEVSGNELILNIGFSHPVKIVAPDGISFKIVKNQITVEGIDKELVGAVSDKIRAVRPPEPYKGKGLHYLGEVVRRKAGKAAKTAGA